MNIAQQEIVLLSYPFTNLEQTKVRPALVISNNRYNKKSSDCIMIPLTSVIKKDQFSVLIHQQDLVAGKLIKPSRIKADKIFTGSKNLIRMKIGKLNKKKFDVTMNIVNDLF